MKTHHKRLLLVVATALTLVVLYNMSLWIWVAARYTTFDETKDAYLEKYPVFLRSAMWLTILDIFLALSAAYLFLTLRQSSKEWKFKWYTILATTNLILAFWQLFSLM
jgi:hypothetical protein